MRALGIILAGGKNEHLKELTHNRALAAMPIAGNYRAIDFSLSNMTNSNIKKVAVVTQYNSRSLVEHLRSSKWWDFGRKNKGLYILTPYISHDNCFWYRGTADAIYQNISYLKDSDEPYVIIAQGDDISKIDYNEVLEYHINKEADITIVCKKLEMQELSRFGHVEVDKENHIVDFEEKPLDPSDNLISTGIYVIERTMLIELIEAAEKESRHDFVSDIIVRYRKRKRIMAYIHTGYWKSIAELDSYYEANMDFLDRELRQYFFKTSPYIMSKAEDEAPAKFNKGTNVSNSLCSPGCIVNGTVENSVLFRKTFIGKNTVIKNSIILHSASIGKDAYIENCIVDSKSVIPDGSHFVGNQAQHMVIVNK
jgi:glucose-1-phosphate adenylyltransferase